MNSKSIDTSIDPNTKLLPIHRGAFIKS